MDKKTFDKIEIIAKQGKYGIGLVDIDNLTLLKINARYMDKPTFDTLVKNIKRDGELSSLPFCRIHKDGKIEVISGNHRVKASKVAGIKRITIMFNLEEMSDDEAKAIQLSHNSISGNDDLNILKKIYESIEDVDMKEYSGLDNKVFEDILNSGAKALQTAEIEAFQVNVFFSEADLKEIDRIIASTKAHTHLYMGEDYNKYLKITEAIENNYNVKNTSIQILIMFKLYEEYVKNGKNKIDGEMAIDGVKHFKIGGFNTLIDENTSKILVKEIKENGFNRIVEFLNGKK